MGRRYLNFKLAAHANEADAQILGRNGDHRRIECPFNLVLVARNDSSILLREQECQILMNLFSQPSVQLLGQTPVKPPSEQMNRSYSRRTRPRQAAASQP